MIAQQVLYRLLWKTAASPLGTLFGSATKSIVPAFEHEAPAISAAIARPPYLKPGLMSQVTTPLAPGAAESGAPGIPRVASDPALEAKSVFRAPPPEQAPTGRYTRPSVQVPVLHDDPRPQAAAPQISSDVDEMHEEEQNLAGQLKNPQLDPSSRVNMQARLKQLYDQMQTGPALTLSDVAGHQAALAARAGKIQQYRARMLSGLLREAGEPAVTPGNAPTQVHMPSSAFDRVP